MTFTLTAGYQAVSALIASLNGAEVERLTGGDLRQVSVLDVPALVPVGQYTLVLTAQTPAGCMAGATLALQVK